MKTHLTALRLTALLVCAVLALTACGKSKDSGSTQNADTSASTDSQGGAGSPADGNSSADIGEIANALAQKYAEYTDMRSSYDEMMAELDESDRMTYEEYLSYQLVTAPVEDTETLMGLTEVPDGIEEAYVYHPGMMGQAYIGYVFKLKQGTNVDTFKSALADAADLRWNICTSANTVVCESAGNIVFFSMMVVVDDENPHGFTAEQKDGFINTFFDSVKA